MAADINPRAAIRTGKETPQTMGPQLGGVVLAAVSDLQPLAGGPVVSVCEPWAFERIRNGERELVSTEIQSLWAGELAVLAIPGELCSRYTARLRDLSPLPATLVLTMANGAIGYLPLEEAYPQGGLEVMRAAMEFVEGPLTEHVTQSLLTLD